MVRDAELVYLMLTLFWSVQQHTGSFVVYDVHTTPSSSPLIHCTMASVFLSQKYMLPQSDPDTINSLRGPKKFTPFTKIRNHNFTCWFSEVLNININTPKTRLFTLLEISSLIKFKNLTTIVIQRSKIETCLKDVHYFCQTARK